MNTTKPKFYCRCFLCDRGFQFGPHIYDGKKVPAWDIMVCSPCLNGNWDGIVPREGSRLVAHLEARGIPITLNDKGWIDFPR